MFRLPYIAILAASALATGVFCQESNNQTASIYLPTLEMYFQCGDMYDQQQDLEAIDWATTFQIHYDSVFPDAVNVNVTDGVLVQSRACVDVDERQFRISVRGNLEYEKKDGKSVSEIELPSPVDLSNLIFARMDELKDALSIACYGDDLDAYDYYLHASIGGPDGPGSPGSGVSDNLGSSSWDTRICLAERLNDDNRSEQDDEESSGLVISTLGIVAIVLGVLFLLGAGICICVFCGVASCLCSMFDL